MSTLKTKIIAIFTGIAALFAALFAIHKLFTSRPSESSPEFPKEEEKKKLEQEETGLKKELGEVEKKEYSDEEIEKKFNE